MQTDCLQLNWYCAHFKSFASVSAGSAVTLSVYSDTNKGSEAEREKLHPPFHLYAIRLLHFLQPFQSTLTLNANYKETHCRMERINTQFNTITFNCAFICREKIQLPRPGYHRNDNKFCSSYEAWIKYLCKYASNSFFSILELCNKYKSRGEHRLGRCGGQWIKWLPISDNEKYKV